MPRDPNAVIALTIYSRPDCHLCEDMKAVVRRIAAERSQGIQVSEVDISNDAELEKLYGVEVPVLLANGRKVAKYGITEQDLRRILARLQAE